MMDRDIRFSEMDKNGKERNVRVIKRSTIMKCPHVILVADHYRADGTCRCNDPHAPMMKEWGYTWNGEKGVWE
jgi:hypothetical protein